MLFEPWNIHLNFSTIVILVYSAILCGPTSREFEWWHATAAVRTFGRENIYDHLVSTESTESSESYALWAMKRPTELQSTSTIAYSALLWPTVKRIWRATGPMFGRENFCDSLLSRKTMNLFPVIHSILCTRYDLSSGSTRHFGSMLVLHERMIRHCDPHSSSCRVRKITVARVNLKQTLQPQAVMVARMNPTNKFT